MTLLEPSAARPTDHVATSPPEMVPVEALQANCTDCITGWPAVSVTHALSVTDSPVCISGRSGAQTICKEAPGSGMRSCSAAGLAVQACRTARKDRQWSTFRAQHSHLVIFATYQSIANPRPTHRDQ